jgi:hypothetical protein
MVRQCDCGQVIIYTLPGAAIQLWQSFGASAKITYKRSCTDKPAVLLQK